MSADVQECAFVIFYDLESRLYMVARADHLHPTPSMRHRIKAVGGKVEPGEAGVREAVIREAEEEQQDWCAIYASGLSVNSLEDVGMFGENGWRTYLFLHPAWLTPESFREAVRSSTEGVPEFWEIDRDAPDENQVAPWFYELLLSAHSTLREKLAAVRAS